MEDATIQHMDSTLFGHHAGSGDPDHACLIRIYPPSIGEGIIQLPRTEIRIGRDSTCHLVLGGKDVSRHHASIDFDPHEKEHRIRDLESLNGTHVNDQRIREKRLEAGDLVRIGKFIFKFLGSDGIERQYHEAIYAMTITDGLTGVANKRCLADALERELVRSRRHERPLSVAMFDIDHFKKINDEFGHLAGDAVLRDLCARVREAVRRDELLARFGGEEFVVILPESSFEQAMVFGERIRCLVASDPFHVDHAEIHVQISVGIATTTGNETMAPENLLARADAGLYEAKNGGRNRVMGREDGPNRLP